MARLLIALAPLFLGCNSILGIGPPGLGTGDHGDAGVDASRPDAPDGARLAITPTAHDFGTVSIGSTAPPATFTIGNIGGARTGTLGITIDDPSYVVASDTCTAHVLDPGMTCTVTSSFAPTGSGGSKPGTLVVATATGGRATAALLGFAATAQYDFDVTRTGSGSGTVTSSPAGIACGTACSASFASGTMVTLTPSPDSASTFVGWGGACSGAGTCSVTVGSVTGVTATFGAAPTGLIVDFAADLGVHASGGVVTSWDDQSGNSFVATTASTIGPRLTTTVVNGSTRYVLRFDGTNYLLASPHVPSAGTLVIVVANTDHGAADRRVLGWDDSALGNHGLSLIPDYHGTNLLLFVARDNGAAGDVQAGSAVAAIEVDVASWGSAGITFERRLATGQVLSSGSSAIQGISDGGLPLHIGAPGDQSSGVQPFIGDLAALRVYNRQLSAPERANLIASVASRWL